MGMGNGDGSGARGLEGGITVFLSLILTCICALMGGLFESVRTAGCGWYMQMALDSSVDSLMSGYHRAVWENYRIFLLEYEDEAGLVREMEPYCLAYLEEAPFYPLKNRQLRVTDVKPITAGGGQYFEEEILDYMKFGIWETERDPKVLAELARSCREASSFHEIAEGYQENGRKVLRLEASIDRIGDCLKKQREYWEEGNRALSDGNGSRFLRAAGSLEKEISRILGLVEEYEKQADRLGAELARSEAEAETVKADLMSSTWDLACEEMAGYRSYTDAEGERRREVRKTKETAAFNRAVVEEAIEEAREVQAYIDSWEPDDEDDKLDEDALWARVLRITGRFREDTRFQKAAVKDKRTMNVLEAVSRMAGGDLLSVCVPKDRTVSEEVANTEEFPSGAVVGGSAFDDGENLLKTGAKRALLNEYASRYFSCFLTGGEKEFQYEQEYILQGTASDRENLKKTVNGMIAVREALNLISLLKDPDKRAEAEGMALVITGAAGLSPLSKVVSFFIMTVWAFAESVEDVKCLLAGGRVPFFKGVDQWKTSLSALAQSGASVWDGKASGAASEEGEGLNYLEWIKVFFLVQNKTQMCGRMMDMIQNNICMTQPEFRMKRCAFRVDAELSGDGPLIPMRRKCRKEY